MNIFSLIQKNRKGLVVCVNKWDLVEKKETADIKAFEHAIRDHFAPFVDFPILFTSATTKQRIFKVLETVKQVYETRQFHVSTAKLNEYFLPLIENYPPPAIKGKYVKIKYVTQLKGPETPTFIFFCNLPQYLKDPYKRFLENKLRAEWKFTGTPVQIFFRQK
jgi:GTP-binding protein